MAQEETENYEEIYCKISNEYKKAEQIIKETRGECSVLFSEY